MEEGCLRIFIHNNDDLKSKAEQNNIRSPQYAHSAMQENGGWKELRKEKRAYLAVFHASDVLDGP